MYKNRLLAAVIASAVLAHPAALYAAESGAPQSAAGAEASYVPVTLPPEQLPAPSASACDSPAGAIASKEEAVERARLLPFLPEQAKLEAVQAWSSPEGLTWDTRFSDENYKRNYSIRFMQDSGCIQFLTIQDSLVAQTEPPVVRDQPVTLEEATAIARAFIDNRDWGVDVEWMLNHYPESAYSTRYDDKTLHKLRFDSSVNGIRFRQNQSTVWVNPDGQIASYHLVWFKHEFEDPSLAISEQAAKQLYLEQSAPVLYKQNTNPDRRLVYSLWQGVLDATTLTFPSERNPNPYIGEDYAPVDEEPTVTAEQANSLLLSLYDIELQYQASLFQTAKLYYKLTLHPDVPRFYSGPAPVLDAHGSGWFDFIGEPLPGPIIPEGNWVDAFLASPERIRYPVAVVLDGQLLQLAQPPVIRDDSTLLPFRSLLEQLGAEVQWIPESSQVIASKGKTRIELTLNSDTAVVNGDAVSLNAPAQLLDNSTYIPARFAVEALGGLVDWNAESRLVLLSLKQAPTPPFEEQLTRWRIEAHKAWELSVK